MKILFSVSLFLFLAVSVSAQTLCLNTYFTNDVSFSERSMNADRVMRNLESGFTNKNIIQIEAFLASGLALRIEDKLYSSISSIVAIDMLKNYLADKKIVSFQRITDNTAKMIYIQNGEKKSIYTDFVINSSDCNVYAMNISNIPTFKAFYR